MPFPLNLFLVHPEPAACDAVRARFAEMPNVRVVQAVFEDLEPVDAFVTAGNAFGIMTAGIDAAVVRVLGQRVMDDVQARIRDEYLGEQPVGTAFVLPTGHPRCRFLVHAPTMRVPGSIAGTDKVYAATWAALLAVYQHNAAARRSGGSGTGTDDGGDGGVIRTVGLPAMGTGFGGVPFGEAARQMAAAYDHYLHPPHRLDWDAVIARQKAICYDGTRQVVKG